MSLLIGIFLINSGLSYAQTEVIDFNSGHDFFLEISIIDTVPCKVTTMRGPTEPLNANLLKISVDSIVRIFNEGIYSSPEELKSTQYMWVPVDVALKKANNYVLTFEQYQKEYFYFYHQTETADIEIVRTGATKVDTSFGYHFGLGFSWKVNKFWRWWGKVNKMPEYKIVAKGKAVKKSKDPVLKCIRKYKNSGEQ